MSKDIKNEEKQPKSIVEIFADNPEGMADYFKLIEENQAKTDKALKKVNDYKFKSKILTDTSNPLTRKEKKKLKKEGFKLSEFDTLDEDKMDDFLDALLEVKGVTEDDADGMNVHEVKIWSQQIVIRTLNPLKFEGND